MGKTGGKRKRVAYKKETGEYDENERGLRWGRAFSDFLWIRSHSETSNLMEKASLLSVII